MKTEMNGEDKYMKGKVCAINNGTEGSNSKLYQMVCNVTVNSVILNINLQKLQQKESPNTKFTNGPSSGSIHTLVPIS